MAKIRNQGQATMWIDSHLVAVLSVDIVQKRPLRELLLRFLWGTGERITAALRSSLENCYEFSDPMKPRARSAILFPKKNRKGKISAREVPIPPVLKDHLDKYAEANLWVLDEIDRTSYLFPSPQNSGSHESYSNFWRWFNLALEKAGLATIGYCSHSFRRYYIYTMSQTLPVRDLISLTGHKNVAGVMPYIDRNQKAIDRAVQNYH